MQILVVRLLHILSYLIGQSRRPVSEYLLWHGCTYEGPQTGEILWLCRDDVNHKGEKIDWGQWAITGNDPDFNGTGNPDTGDDYGPAPGRPSEPCHTASTIGTFEWVILQ